MSRLLSRARDDEDAQGRRRQRRRLTSSLPGDLFAGMTLWAVFAAQAIAYSRLAHATPVAGLVTAIAGATIYALLGTSRRNSIGPAGGIAAIVGAAVSAVPPDRLGPSIAALTLLAAAFLFLAGLARISFLARLFPAPVFVGYLAGVGVTILVGQGRELVSHGAVPLAVGLAAMAGVVGLKHLAPRVPGPFVVLLAATVASAALDLSRAGVPVIGSTLGHFGAFTWPSSLGWSGIAPMVGPAASLALLVYVDALANGEALAKEADPPIQPTREYYALAAVNLAAGLFGGFMAGCSSSRSVVGIRAGERTKLAGGVAGVLLVLTALSVVRFLQPMPLAALAGVVFVAAIDLVDVKKLRELWAMRRADFVIAIVAGAGVLVIGPVGGAGLGVAMALAEAFRRAMDPDRGVLSSHPEPGRLYEPFVPSKVVPSSGIIVYRFGAPLFFGNADVFLADMRALARSAPPSLHTVVVNADALGVPDATAREMLAKAQAVLRQRGAALVFGNARKALRDALAKAGTFTMIEENEFVADVRAVRATL